MRISLTSGPYESAVSMKLTPSSTARRNTVLAASRSGGSPQIPRPVTRIAPKPRRLTVRSPPIVIVADDAALTAGSLMARTVRRGIRVRLCGYGGRRLEGVDHAGERVVDH